MSNKNSTENSVETSEWDSLNINPLILKTIKEKFKFTKITPIQKEAIPVLLKGRDVVAQAKTGSGKTLAYVVPMLDAVLKEKERLKQLEPTEEEKDEEYYDLLMLKNDNFLGLILAPTRELARQIYEVLLMFKEDTGIKPQIVAGSAKKRKRPYDYAGDIGVCTPGTLKTLIKKDFISLKNVIMVVFDEADRMLESGYAQAINFILKDIPKTRTTGLFSATQTSSTEELVRSGLENPHKIIFEEQVPEQLINYFMIVNQDSKFNQLFWFLSKYRKSAKIIVYFLTCKCVDYYYSLLKLASTIEKKKLNLISLHGKQPRGERNRRFEKFKEIEHGVLLCTDVGSRGLDIPEVDYVIQVDAPLALKTFIHRIGRTARMERKGISLLFIDEMEKEYISSIRAKNVTIKQIKQKETKDVLNEIVEYCRKEKDEKVKSLGNEAFISFMSTYYKHSSMNVVPDDELVKSFWKRLTKAYFVTSPPQLHEHMRGIGKIIAIYEEFREEVKGEKKRLRNLNKKRKREERIKEQETSEEKPKNKKQKKNEIITDPAKIKEFLTTAKEQTRFSKKPKQKLVPLTKAQKSKKGFSRFR